MKILAIETATKACSAALWLEGELIEQFELAPQRHANLILSQIDQCFSQAKLKKGDIDALAFGEGPGAFTGVRIAAGVIQGLALGWDKPVIAVSSLEALIWQAYLETGQTHWHAFLDARMKEVYWQSGHIQDEKLISQPCQLLKLEALPKVEAAGIGDIATEYPEVVASYQNQTSWLTAYPKASAIAAIASQRPETMHLLEQKIPLPVYLRNNVADKPKASKNDSTEKGA